MGKEVKISRIMKKKLLFILFNFIVTTFLYSQDTISRDKHKQDIYALIENHAQAREQKVKMPL